LLVAATTYASRARAQQQPQGFAVERLYQSAPGGGWFVMDDLDMRGGLGGAVALTTGYAMKPLRVTDGSQHLAVVSDQAFADFGFAVTYERWRLYLNLHMPLVTEGQSGLDARVLGSARSAFRLGAGAQLIAPNGSRYDPDTGNNNYDTDGTFRAMGRVLFAGDVGPFAYAGQLGIHIRPLDDSPIPGSPQGSELLFGVAGGPRIPIGIMEGTVVVVGPEIFGETALRSPLSTNGTGLEALLTGRLEGTADDGAQLRVKLGTGGGISQHFGVPEWRIVLGVELFDHSAHRE
jgi:hypothetical protein